MLRNIDFVKVFILAPQMDRWHFPLGYEEGEWVQHPKKFWRYRLKGGRIELNVWCGRIVNQSSSNLLNIADINYWNKCVQALVDTYNQFDIPMECVPSSMELGNTIKVGKEARKFISNILCFSNTAVLPIARRRMRIGVKAKRCQRVYKVYIKDNRYLNFEIRFIRRDEIRALKVRSIYDLCETRIKKKMDDIYMKAWNKFISLPYIPKAPNYLPTKKEANRYFHINKEQIKTWTGEDRRRLLNKVRTFEKKHGIESIHQRYAKAFRKIPKPPSQLGSHIFLSIQRSGNIEFQFMYFFLSQVRPSARLHAPRSRKFFKGSKAKARAPPKVVAIHDTIPQTSAKKERKYGIVM